MKQLKLIEVNADWWAELSPAGQEEYMEEHPNSKFARDKATKHTEKHEQKQSQKQLQDKQKQSKKEAQPKPKLVEAPKLSFRDKLKSMMGSKELPPATHEFFEKEQDKPGSEQRKTLATHIKTHSKGIVSHIASQAKEWHTGCKALKKLASGHPLSDHDKKALKSIVMDTVVTVGMVAATGGLSAFAHAPLAHALPHVIKHLGVDYFMDFVKKAVIDGVVQSANIVLSSSSDEKMMRKLVDKIADLLENGDIPEDVWEKVIKDMAEEEKKKGKGKAK